MLEDDHRADRVTGPEVGDVEALDTERQIVEAERVAQPGERPLAGVAPLRDPLGLDDGGLFGIAARHLEQAAFGAALGPPHDDS